jgi:CRP/FNR family cyclic AMP-dependent transcriptional regulator
LIDNGITRKIIYTEEYMDAQHLEQIDLFSKLSTRAKNALAGLLVLKNYEPGQTIVRQGTASDGIFVLLSGEVQIVRVTESGSQVVLNQMTSGIFGTLSTIDGGTRGADCVAKTSVQAAFLKRPDFIELIQGSSTMALGFQVAIIRSMFSDIRKTNDELATLSSLTPIEEIQLIEIDPS